MKILIINTNDGREVYNNRPLVSGGDGGTVAAVVAVVVRCLRWWCFFCGGGGVGGGSGGCPVLVLVLVGEIVHDKKVKEENKEC